MKDEILSKNLWIMAHYKDNWIFFSIKGGRILYYEHAWWIDENCNEYFKGAENWRLNGYQKFDGMTALIDMRVIEYYYKTLE